MTGLSFTVSQADIVPSGNPVVCAMVNIGPVTLYSSFAALEQAMRDVETSFAALRAGELAIVNGKLKAKGLTEIAVLQPVPEPAGGGGELRAVAGHLVGLQSALPSGLPVPSDARSASPRLQFVSDCSR